MARSYRIRNFPNAQAVAFSRSGQQRQSRHEEQSEGHAQRAGDDHRHRREAEAVDARARDGRGDAAAAKDTGEERDHAVHDLIGARVGKHAFSRSERSERRENARREHFEERALASDEKCESVNAVFW